MNRTLKHRLEQLESRSGIGEDLPTLFIMIYDASVPDPDRPPETGPGDVIGLSAGAGIGPMLVVRQAGESVDELKARAQQQHPECRVFMMEYTNQSRDRYPMEAEAWEAAAIKQQAELLALEASVYAKRADR